MKPDQEIIQLTHRGIDTRELAQIETALNSIATVKSLIVESSSEVETETAPTKLEIMINSNPVLLRLREEIEKGLAGKWIRPIQETIRKRKVPFKLSIKFFDWSSVETLFKTKPEVERLPILKTAFRRFFARKGKYSMMEEKQYLFNERKKKWDLVDGKK